LRSLNCAPEPVFRAAGFEPSDFSDTNFPIRYEAASRLIANCVAASGCEHFGILLGQWCLASHLGLAGHLARSAPDVGTAVRDIVDNLALHDRGATGSLEVVGNRAEFAYAIILPNLTGIEYVYDLSLANMCGIMRSLCGMAWRPGEVHLSRAQPGDTRPYRDYFRTDIVFDALESKLTFSSDWLERPLQTADDHYHTDLAQGVHQMKETAAPGLSTSVRDSLRRDLTRGAPRIETTARKFNLHERTLNRRLAAEGTNFRTLLDEVRQAVSQHYLEGTALSVGEIAMALGYGSTDAFDHAFRRWFGLSPTQWRLNGQARKSVVSKA
jgi:AraC-like DNA-binding protein